MERMLVTQALNELKLLDSRINKNINEACFVAAARTASDKVKNDNKTKQEFEEKAKSDFASITALIDRRMSIKSAIILSNANTKVSFDGVEYTIAELIDMKSSIEYQESLLKKMESNLYEAINTVECQNSYMQGKIDKLVETSIGTADKKKVNSADANDIESISTIYRKNNEYSLVDPLKINDEIIKRREYIEKFKAGVDSILQISNCTTYIEV